MNFMQALDELQKGNLVTRPEWEAKGEFMVLYPGVSHIWKVVTVPTPNTGMFTQAIEDLMALDWKILDRSIFPIKKEEVKLN